MKIADPLVRGTLSTVAKQLTQQLRPHGLGFALSMFRLDDLYTLRKATNQAKVPEALIATNAKLSEALAVLSSWVDTERAKEREREVKSDLGGNGTPHRRFELRVAVIDTERAGIVHERILGNSDVLENMARLMPRVFVEVDDDGS